MISSAAQLMSQGSRTRHQTFMMTQWMTPRQKRHAAAPAAGPSSSCCMGQAQRWQQQVLHPQHQWQPQQQQTIQTYQGRR
jgi:hypothetical protein